MSPQTAATIAFQAQTATGKLNAVMIADRPQRVPLLDHPVPGPLAGDRQAVELARQADGEVAHVDHLLDLALALGADLARLERDQQAQVRLVLAERLRRSGGRPRPAAAPGPSASVANASARPVDDPRRRSRAEAVTTRASGSPVAGLIDVSSSPPGSSIQSAWQAPLLTSESISRASSSLIMVAPSSGRE